MADENDRDDRPFPDLPRSKFDLRVVRLAAWVRDVAGPWADRVQARIDKALGR